MGAARLGGKVGARPASYASTNYATDLPSPYLTPHLVKGAARINLANELVYIA